MSSKIVMAVSDLFFAARIRETAARLGIQIAPVAKEESVSDVIQREQPALLVIDLNDTRFDPLATIRAIKSTGDLRPVQIVGFLSHVQTDLHQAALGAGCDQVLPRSKFTQSLPQILQAAVEDSST